MLSLLPKANTQNFRSICQIPTVQYNIQFHIFSNNAMHKQMQGVKNSLDF